MYLDTKTQYPKVQKVKGDVNMHSYHTCLNLNLPPQSVHCNPYFSSNLMVMKKFRTEPSREKPRVRPKAKLSSLPLNQKAVIRSCTTDDITKNIVLKPCKWKYIIFGKRWPYHLKIHSQVQRTAVLRALTAAEREFLESGSPVQTEQSRKHREERIHISPLQWERIMPPPKKKM